MQRCSSLAACLLAAVVSLCVHAGEDTLAPALEADPSSDGLITWWLHSPMMKSAGPTPPANARECEPIGGGAWSTFIAPARFVDLKPFTTGRTGMFWVSTRINSTAGGARKVRVGSYCGLKVYRDGQLVLDKPQPMAPFPDEAEAQIEIPRGCCEFLIAITVRSGFCGFQFNLTEGQALGGLPRAVAGDRILVPTQTGKEPDHSAAALKSAAFFAKEMFVTPGQPVVLAAGMPGSLPVNLGQLNFIFSGPDGKAYGTHLPARTAAETARAFWQVEYPVPADAGFVHEVTLEIKAADRSLGKKQTSLFSLKGLAANANALEREIGQRSQGGKTLPNAALAVEKLKLFLSKIESNEERVTRDLGGTLLQLLSSARALLEQESAGKDPWEGKTGYFERAYISRIDDQPQPYFVNIPAAYAEWRAANDGKKHPLVVFLHGYVPAYDKHRWWEEMPDFNASVEKHGAFLAIPFGRSNTDFQSCGEVDVMDVIAEMKRLYPIDDDRVYLYGYSMGGMSVYTIGAHYPDQFAAGIVFCGRADSPLQNFNPLERFSPFKQWLIHADNPISLCENFINLPLRIYHGKEDFIINVKEAERMNARLKDVGANPSFVTMNGDHWAGFEIMGTDDPMAWLMQHKRLPQPAKRRMKAYSLRHAAQAGVRVTAATGELKPIELEWTPTDGGAQFTLDSQVIVQREVKGVRQPAVLEGLRKTPELCGPVREAICGPFIIVHGTSGTAEANLKNKALAEKFATEWFGFTRSRAIVKADKDVTDDDKKNKNLFLFGEEQDNLLHAAAAKDLPISVKAGEVTIGEKKFPLAGRGIMYLYPSPFRAKDKPASVVIMAGSPYGKDVGINHKLDLVPDFLLYDEKADTDGTGTNTAICAGFFNGEWKLDAKTMWVNAK